MPTNDPTTSSMQTPPAHETSTNLNPPTSDTSGSDAPHTHAPLSQGVPSHAKKSHPVATFFSAMRWQGWASCALLLFVLVPLFAISPYNHSYADDWHYGVWSHLALESGAGVLGALAEALRQVGVAWFGWQGTYSAIFLMAIQPGVFGEHLYSLAAPILLELYCVSAFYLSYVIFKHYLGCSRTVWVSVACVGCAVSLLLQPSPVEGIFWYNSAMYYTGYNAFLFILVGHVLKTVCPYFHYSTSRRRRRTIVATLLAAFVAGGNFVTLLVAVELAIIWVFYLYVDHRDAELAHVAPPTAALVVGAIVSFAAPGNAVRQSTQFSENALSALDTCLQGSAAAFRYLCSWSGSFVLLGLLFLAPLIIRSLQVSKRAHDWNFSHPALVSFLSVAVFASSFTPTFRSMGTEGPGRVQDCRFELFVAFALVNLVWWCGWFIAQRRQATPAAAQIASVGRRQTSVACALAAAVFVASLVSFATTDDSREELSSFSAWHSFQTGQAQAYDTQVKARLAFLESTDAASVSVPFYTDVPHVLLMGDIRDNMNNYINYRLAQWYSIDSIVGYQTTDANKGFHELASTDTQDGLNTTTTQSSENDL